MYATMTRILRCDKPELKRSQSALHNPRLRCHDLRKTTIKGCDAKLERPKNTSIKGPAYDLNLGPPNPIVVFLAVHIDIGSLLVGHVTIRKALEFRTNEICCDGLGSEYKLAPTWSVLSKTLTCANRQVET
jgi:hypothetical protein